MRRIVAWLLMKIGGRPALRVRCIDCRNISEEGAYPKCLAYKSPVNPPDWTWIDGGPREKRAQAFCWNRNEDGLCPRWEPPTARSDRTESATPSQPSQEPEAK